MTQKSWPWSTVAAIGDGATTLSEAISREFLAAWFLVQNFANEGVSKGVGGELAVTGAASPLAVASGSGVCYGMYINDAATTTPAISTPAVGPTGGRVVLRTSWAAATTRIAVIKSADGVAAIPALTQVFGTTWEISLATFVITTGGVITVTDARVYRRSTGVVGTNELEALALTSAKLGALAVIAGKIADGAVDTTARLANNIVTAAKMFQLAGLSILGRSANTTGDMAAITAANDGEVLRRAGTALVFGKLADANMTAGGLTHASLANRARAFAAPVNSAYNVTDSVPLRSGASGMVFLDNKYYEVGGSFVVPRDYASGLTVSVVMFAAFSGNAYISFAARGGQLGANLSSHTAGSPSSFSAVAIVANQIKAMVTLDLEAAGFVAGDIVALFFEKDGTHASDTINGTSLFEQFQVSYTADM